MMNPLTFKEIFCTTIEVTVIFGSLLTMLALHEAKKAKMSNARAFTSMISVFQNLYDVFFYQMAQ